MSLTLYDETPSGQKRQVLVLTLLTETITVRELIRSRVYQEVKDYNTRRPDTFNTLVQPTDAEMTLNGYRFRQPRSINWETQFEKALAAFQSMEVHLSQETRAVEEARIH